MVVWWESELSPTESATSYIERCNAWPFLSVGCLAEKGEHELLKIEFRVPNRAMSPCASQAASHPFITGQPHPRDLGALTIADDPLVSDRYTRQMQALQLKQQKSQRDAERKHAQRVRQQVPGDVTSSCAVPLMIVLPFVNPVFDG